MEYMELVVKTYREAIALKTDIPHDLKTALKHHERIPLFFKNLAAEIENVQKLRNRQGKKHYDEKLIKDIIYDFTDIFIQGLVAEAKARYDSDLTKAAKASEAQAAKEIEEATKGNLIGDMKDVFTEGGVIATDDRSVL